MVIFVVILPLTITAGVLYILLKNKDKDICIKEIFTGILILVMIFSFVFGSFVSGSKIADMLIGEGDSYKICNEKFDCSEFDYPDVRMDECYDKRSECIADLQKQKNLVMCGAASFIGVLLGILGFFMRKDKPLFIGFLSSLLLILVISGIILGADGYPILLFVGLLVAIIVYFRDRF